MTAGRTHRIIQLALMMAMVGCADARLVESPEPPEPEVQGDRADDEHLHEDGNWYAGWAIPVSEELAEVTTVTEDRLIVPRDELFDLELSILTPMDIVVGASEEQAFLKRVLSVDFDENQWEITVEDAQLQDVFIEGKFRLDSADSDAGSQTRQQDLLEPSEQGSGGEYGETRRQPQSAAFAEEKYDNACGRNCTASQEFEVGAGIRASFSPQVEIVRGSGGQGVTGRFLFEFENVFPQNKRKNRSMCTNLSSDLGKLRDRHRTLVEAFRGGSSRAQQAAIEEHAEARIELYEWALRYAGHSPFPPFVTNNDGVVILQNQAGDVCHIDSLHWYTPGDFFTDRLLGLGCTVRARDNVFFVEKQGDGYGIHGSKRDRVYHAMEPDFRVATHEVSRVIEGRSGFEKVFENRFPPHLRGLSAGAVRSEDTEIDHRDQQWVHSSIDLKEFDDPGSFTLPAMANAVESDGFARSSARVEQLLREDRDLWDKVRGLRERAIVEDLSWFAGSIGVGKLYCSGADITSARMGAGAKFDFTYAPKFGVQFGASASARASSVKTTEKDLEIFGSSKIFTVGPVPVQLDLVGTLGASVTAQISGKIEAQLRKHRGEVDAFIGLEYVDGSWKMLTLKDFQASTSNSEGTGGNTYKLLESPNNLSKERYFEETDLVDFNGNLSGKLGLETGIGFELILYKTFGIGAGVNLTKELEVGYDTASGFTFDVTVGPTAKLFSSLKLPLCKKKGSCDEFKEAFADICRFPPHSESPICGGGFDCAERPYLCPTFSGANSEVKIQIPVFNSCNWLPFTAEPQCKFEGWSDPELRAFPPCFKACYRSRPATGNKWIALYTDDVSTHHAWAQADADDFSTIGVAVDSIEIAGPDGKVFRPEVVEVDGEGIDREEMRRLDICRNVGCGRDLDSCNAPEVRSSLVHFKRSMLIKLDGELRPDDLVDIVEQHIPRSTSPNNFECGGRVSYRVAVGSGEGEGCWKEVGRSSEDALGDTFYLSESSFASRSNCQMKNSDIVN